MPNAKKGSTFAFGAGRISALPAYMIEHLLRLLIEGVLLLTLFFGTYFSKIHWNSPFEYSVAMWNGMIGVTKCDG